MALVIVGASLGGLRAAQGARAAGFDGEIVVIGAERHMPYTRPPLSKELLFTPEHQVDDHLFPIGELDVTWRLGSPATALDPEAHRITLGDGATLDYERLVIATGCRARTWAGPGADLEGVFTIRDVDDALALRAALQPGARLLIAGAGFIGCEVAASARTLGVEVTLVDIAATPMPVLGPVLGERCAALHRDHGVDLRLETAIAGFVGSDGRLTGVELGDGTRIDADVALVALGGIPNTEWLEGSGLTLEPGVLCDAQLAAVGVEDVFCAGDVVAWPHPLADMGTIRIEHWTNAAEQGTLAGRNAVAEPDARQAYAAVPSFWSDQYDVKIQAIGLPRRATAVRVVEATPEGDRFVAIGERDGRLVAALAFNGARRLPWYRRQVTDGATVAAVLAVLADDPKAMGPAPAQATS